MNKEQMNAKITSLDPPQATEIREKPKPKDFGIIGRRALATLEYNKAMQDYKLSQIPMDIENVYEKFTNHWIIYDENGSRIGVIKLNQSVQIVRTESGCKIVKIETLNIGTNKSQNAE